MKQLEMLRGPALAAKEMETWFPGHRIGTLPTMFDRASMRRRAIHPRTAARARDWFAAWSLE
jgi:hypothetical protein